MDRFRVSPFHFTRGYIGAALASAWLIDAPDDVFAPGMIDDKTHSVLSDYAENYLRLNDVELVEYAQLHPLETIVPKWDDAMADQRPMLTSWTLGMILHGSGAGAHNGFQVCDSNHDVCRMLHAAAPPPQYWLQAAINGLAILGPGTASMDNPAWIAHVDRQSYPQLRATRLGMIRVR